MGIKGIHLFLIAASTTLSLLFSLWAFNNQLSLMGAVSILSAIALAFYGVNFYKKVVSK